MQQIPLKQEIVEWKANKVSKYLVQELQNNMNEIKDQWMNGGFTLESESGTLQMNSRALGNIKALGETLDFIENNMDAGDTLIYEH